MDAKTFDMVDGILANTPRGDARQSAFSLLEVGSQQGNLELWLPVVAREFGLQLDTVLEWYTETLERRIESYQYYLEKMKEAEGV